MLFESLSIDGLSKTIVAGKLLAFPNPNFIPPVVRSLDYLINWHARMCHEKLGYFFCVLKVLEVLGFPIGHGVSIQSPGLTSGPCRGIVQTLARK